MLAPALLYILLRRRRCGRRLRRIPCLLGPQPPYFERGFATHTAVGIALGVGVVVEGRRVLRVGGDGGGFGGQGGELEARGALGAGGAGAVRGAGGLLVGGHEGLEVRDDGGGDADAECDLRDADDAGGPEVEGCVDAGVVDEDEADDGEGDVAGWGKYGI
jgi:hypothetical protein